MKTVEKIKKTLEKYDFTGVNTKIIVDTELEHQISLTYTRKYYCGYRRRVFEFIEFDPCLGYGEDRDFWYNAQKVLNVNLNIKCDTVLGWHLPHTYSEYANQSIWYATTYPTCIKKVYKYPDYSFLQEIYSMLLGVIFSIHPILFLFITLKLDLNCSERSPSRLNFVLLDLLRKYIFIFYFLKASIQLGIFSIYGRLLADYLLKSMHRRRHY